MEFTQPTKDVLANFASINPSLLFRQGNELRTLSPGYDIIAIANVTESFPQTFGIYDLSRFLGVLSLFEKPNAKFGEKGMVFEEGACKVNYTYAMADLILTPPEDEIEMPEIKAQFDLTDAMLKNLSKVVGSLRLPEIVFQGDGKVVTILVKDVKEAAKSKGVFDYFSHTIGKTKKEFSVVFKAEKIQKLKTTEDYKVTIAYGQVGEEKAGLVSFECNSVKYFITPEETSKFESL